VKYSRRGLLRGQSSVKALTHDIQHKEKLMADGISWTEIREIASSFDQQQDQLLSGE
jgi:hypothetical protein